jgi:hypothetical protein
MSTASPRDLDPKFKDTTPTDTNTTENDDARDTSPEGEPEGGWIVARRRWVDNNGVAQSEDSRMPVSEYAKYEKENNL